MFVSPSEQALSAGGRRQQENQPQVAPLTNLPEKVPSSSARPLRVQLASPGNSHLFGSSSIPLPVRVVERQQELSRNAHLAPSEELQPQKRRLPRRDNIRREIPVFGLALISFILIILQSSASSLLEAKSINDRFEKLEEKNSEQENNLDALIALERSNKNSPPANKSSSDLERHQKEEDYLTKSLDSLLKTTPLAGNFVETSAKLSDKSASQANATESSSSEKENEKEEEEEVTDGASTGDDDCASESCETLSADEPAEAKNLTDNERLVNLQSSIQGKMRKGILGATRSGLEMFERLSLSGGCTASLMKLMSSLGDIKSFAFKFLDASAKVPSGVMFGLLSDYGDFDECLSIRSNPQVEPELEAEMGAYSGKYCLLSVKMNYQVSLEPNSSVPEGIQEDGILWDKLIRNYWTTKSTKGFHVGLCLPSRCTTDDIDQLFKALGSNYNFLGDIVGCQDGLDLKSQSTPDQLQRFIINAFYLLLCLTSVGTIIERYFYANASFALPKGGKLAGDEDLAKVRRLDAIHFVRLLIGDILICFSISRNWNKFTGKSENLMGADAEEKSANRFSEFIPTINTNSNISMAPTTEQSSTSRSMMLDQSFLVACQQVGDETRGKGLMGGLGDAKETSKLGQLTVRIQPDNYQLLGGSRTGTEATRLVANELRKLSRPATNSLSSLSGLKLFVIIWITIGHSFWYPSANNYQYYRSIINMNFTRDSVWFAATNFTLGVDMLLYMIGLVFVYKLAGKAKSPSDGSSLAAQTNGQNSSRLGCAQVVEFLARKVLRLWPTYLSLIALAILVPLVSDGPLWPEMVSRRIGDSCRENWWSNLLFVNNFLQNQSQICLPSSWFVSIMMQLFLIGSLIMVLRRKHSLAMAMSAIILLLLISCAYSFAFAYLTQLRAPMIKMDESFVMELDENLFRLYTNLFNNLGPFLIGMIGGFILLKAQSGSNEPNSPGQRTNITTKLTHSSSYPKLNTSKLIQALEQTLIAFIVLILAILVLSSVFHAQYTTFWASIYWSLHRIGWAIVTGYIIHMCATRKWQLLNDMLSLSSFIPLSKLIFIAYLVYPIFIHLHSGFVRDGLHVSIYNMLNIYITRLVMTFTTALLIHLLVELPFHSLEEIFLDHLIKRFKGAQRSQHDEDHRLKLDQQSNPLLTVAPEVTLCTSQQTAAARIDLDPLNVIEE